MLKYNIFGVILRPDKRIEALYENFIRHLFQKANENILLNTMSQAF